MLIRPEGTGKIAHASHHKRDERRHQPVSHDADNNDAELIPDLNLHGEMVSAAEEMADILSAFGRFSKFGRKNDNADNDFISAILEDNVDDKLDSLLREIPKFHIKDNLLNFVRSYFPHDSDLVTVLRELLLSRRLSELLKRKIKKAIKEVIDLGERQRIISGINISRVAKRFSKKGRGKSLSAKDLRDNYLRFLELDLPPGYLYQDWIEEYGCHHRKRLLAFTLSALIADMKANEPGIHCDEFGPLSAKLSEARIIHTLDVSLNEKFAAFPFRKQLRNRQLMVEEEDIVELYMAGLLDVDLFKENLKVFSRDYMSLLLTRQRATLIQALRNIFHSTPEYLYADNTFRDVILNFISSLLTSFAEKEQQTGIWNEYYR